MTGLSDARGCREDQKACSQDADEDSRKADLPGLGLDDAMIGRKQQRRERTNPLGTGNEQNDSIDRYEFEQQAGQQAAGKKAQRRPEPDAAIVDTVVSTSLDRQDLDQRPDWRKECRRKHGHDQQAQKAVNEVEQPVTDEGCEGRQHDDAAAVAGQVGQVGAQRHGEDADGHHRRHDQGNLGIGQSLASQPQRQERHLDASPQEEESVEGRKPDEKTA